MIVSLNTALEMSTAVIRRAEYSRSRVSRRIPPHNRPKYSFASLQLRNHFICTTCTVRKHYLATIHQVFGCLDHNDLGRFNLA